MDIDGLCVSRGLELGGHSCSGLEQPVGAGGNDDETEVGAGFPADEMLPLSTDDGDGDRPRNLWVDIALSMYL